MKKNTEAHGPRIFQNGNVSDFHYGLAHKPIDFLRDEKSTTLGLYESRIHVRSGSTGEEGQATCACRNPHGPLLPHTLRARKTSPRSKRGETCFGWTASSTTVEKSSGDNFQPPGMADDATGAVQAHTQAHMKPPDSCDCGERVPSVWISVSSSRRPKHWNSTEDPVFPLERNLCEPIVACIVVGKNTRRSTSFNKIWEWYQRGSVFTSSENQNYSCPCMWTTSRCLEREKLGTYEEGSAKGERPGGSDPFAE